MVLYLSLPRNAPRVREHVQGVELGFRRVHHSRGFECFVREPVRLPLLLDVRERVPSATSGAGIGAGFGDRVRGGGTRRGLRRTATITGCERRT